MPSGIDMLTNAWRRVWSRPTALRIVGELLFCLIILQLVSGLYLQSQIALFAGRIVLPNLVPKLLLVGSVVLLAAAVLVRRQGHCLIRPCFLPSVLFGCYLVVDAAYLLVLGDISGSALFLGLNKYYMFFLVIPAAALLPPLLGERPVVAHLVVLFVPLLCLAYAQFATNDPLLQVVSEDGSLEMLAIVFDDGQIRAFSLFRDPLNFGQALAFFAGLCVAFIAATHRQRTWLFAPLLLLTIAGCFVTFRRAAYLECAGAVFAALAITRRWRLRKWLPCLYFLGGLLLAVIGPWLISSNVQGVLSSETLAERHGIWKDVFERWLQREDISIFLGTGLSQIEPYQIDFVLVDNAFLAVGMQLGLIGLALWCWVMDSLWRDLLAVADQTGSPLATAGAALMATWLLRGIFDPVFAWYPLFALLVWVAAPGPVAVTSESAEHEAKDSQLIGGPVCV